MPPMSTERRLRRLCRDLAANGAAQSSVQLSDVDDEASAGEGLRLLSDEQVKHFVEQVGGSPCSLSPPAPRYLLPPPANSSCTSF